MENLLLSCIESRVENNRSFYGRFQLGPFNIGQSVTIANAMRRTLLSELSGLAIIAVEIQGVSHEYSTIKGVRESVLDILLNLKQVVLSSDKKCNQPEIGFLKIQGPGVVKTSNFKLPSFIQCVDPDQYIATLSDNGILEMKFMICEGKNFLVETPLPLIEKSFQLNFQTKNSIKKNEKENLQRQAPAKGSSSFKPLVSNSENDVKKSVPQKETSSLTKNKFSRLTSKIQFSETNLLVTTRNFQEFEKTLLNQNKKLNDTVVNNKYNNPVNEFKSPFNSLDYKPTSEDPGKIVSSSSSPSLELETVFDEQKINVLPRQAKKDQNFFFDEKKINTNLLIIDPVFMPISKVNFLIENVDEFSSISNTSLANRLKKTFLQEKIILEIWTNGSIHPRHAIHKAAQKLIDVFVPFQKTYFYKKTKFPVNSSFNILSDKTKVKKTEKTISPLDKNKLLFKDGESSPSLSLNKIYRPWRAQLKKNDFPLFPSLCNAKDNAKKKNSEKYAYLASLKSKKKLKREFHKITSHFSYKTQSSDIASLNLPFKSYICLKRANINTIDDILNCSRDELVSLKNFGEKSLKRLENILLDRNCKLQD